MTLVLSARVKETSTTTGTGTYSLAGAPTGFQTFVAGIGNGNTCYYTAEDGTNWEEGIGTVTDATPDTLARTLVLSSSNAGAAVNWGAGTKNIFCTISPHSYPYGDLITPAQITADQNNYAPTGHQTASVMRLSSDGSIHTITGIAGGYDGRFLLLVNVSATTINLADRSASSSAANRIATISFAWSSLQPYGAALLRYDGTDSLWYVINDRPPRATQADQEGGTAFNYVSSGTQQFHQSAAKCWGFTTGGGTPTLSTAYNMTSITDTATGRLTVTIATDFSSAAWTGQATCTCATNANRITSLVSKAAGSVILESSSATTTLADPGTGWDWVFYGDQA